MNVNGSLLARERERLGLSQRQVGDKLGKTQTAISRLETDAAVDSGAAIEYLRAITSNLAPVLEQHHGVEWQLASSTVPLDHPDIDILIRAEGAFAALKQIQDRTDAAHFLQSELKLYEGSLRKGFAYLESLEHQLCFVGGVGVGKTTAICTTTGLMQNDGQPILDCRGGRTTLCEVTIKHGPAYGVQVDPLSQDDGLLLVDDFCDHLWRIAGDKGDLPISADSTDVDNDGSQTLTTEMQRCLRNMSELVIQRNRKQRTTHDPALALVRQVQSKKVDPTAAMSALKQIILEKIGFKRRTETEIWIDASDEGTALIEIKKLCSDINHGRDSRFSVPRAVHIILPRPAIPRGPEGSSTAFKMTVIDTKGIDGTAKRPDLGRYFDDDRSVKVICSRFEGAPDAEAHATLEFAIQAGLRDRIPCESILLVLDRAAEAESVNDFDGNRVETREDGREAKQFEIVDKLRNRWAMDDVPVSFFNQTKDSRDALLGLLNERVADLRNGERSRLSNVLDQINLLESDLRQFEDMSSRRCLGETVKAWVSTHRQIPLRINLVRQDIPQGICEKGVHASSIRASVNRRGAWINFDYYFLLSHGARADFVEAASPAIKNLISLLQNLMARDDLRSAHGLIAQLLEYVRTETSSMMEHVQLACQAIFDEPLRMANKLWSHSQERWGGGPGYKADLSSIASEWLNDNPQRAKFDQLETALGEEWRRFYESILVLVLRAIGQTALSSSMDDNSSSSIIGDP